MKEGARLKSRGYESLSEMTSLSMPGTVSIFFSGFYKEKGEGNAMLRTTCQLMKEGEVPGPEPSRARACADMELRRKGSA